MGGPEKTRRILVVFNGSTGNVDGVAKVNAGVTKNLVDMCVTQEADCEHVFVLMDSDNIWQNNQNVSVAYPSEKALKDVVRRIKEMKVDKNTDIYFGVMGHGGGEGKSHFLGDTMSAETFINIVNEIPEEAQRIFSLNQCHAAAFLAFKGIPDENDLLTSYSGRQEIVIAKKDKTEEKITLTEVNWTDGRDLGLVYGDRTSYRRMFWSGKRYSAGDLLNQQRGFVFSRGTSFIDRGFVGDGSADAFGSSVVEVKADMAGPAIAELNEILMQGYKNGITILCYDLTLQEPTRSQARKQLDELSKKYKGIAQFVWVDRPTSLAFLQMVPNTNYPDMPFSFRFYEAKEEKIILGTKNMVEQLAKVLNGFSIGDSKW